MGTVQETQIMMHIAPHLRCFFVTWRYNRDMTYKIMSFNLLTNHLYDIGKNRFTSRAVSILKLIHQEKPDLIGVQELTPLSEKKLRDLTELYGMTGEYRLGSKYWFNESNAIFYRKDKFELLDGTTYWLSKTPEKMKSCFLTSIFPRIAVFAILKDKETGNIFTMINTHLDHGREAVRTAQAKIITTLASHHSIGDFTIITGDFNTIPSSDAIRIFSEHGYLDLVDDSTGSTLRGKLGTLAHHNQPIDHILIKGDINARNISVHHECYDGIYPSDHWPLSAILEV